MKTYISTLLFCFASISLFAQKMPDDFVLLKVIQAKDLIIGAPSDFMFTEDLSKMIISYDYKPTYLAVYDTETWEQVYQVEASGMVLLGLSYLDCENNELLYAYYDKNKYSKINVLSGFTLKIKTKDLPTDKCGYVYKGDPIQREQKFLIKDRFFVVLNHPAKTIQVFGKREKKI